MKELHRAAIICARSKNEVVTLFLTFLLFYPFMAELLR